MPDLVSVVDGGWARHEALQVSGRVCRSVFNTASSTTASTGAVASANVQRLPVSSTRSVVGSIRVLDGSLSAFGALYLRPANNLSTVCPNKRDAFGALLVTTFPSTVTPGPVYFAPFASIVLDSVPDTVAL
jgi:hypothetical protein